MLEPWRSRYLQALGVDIYVPRVLLPGAKPALEPAWDPAALMPAPAVAPVLEAQSTAATVAPAPAQREAMALPMLDLPREGGRPAPVPRQHKAAEPSAPTAPTAPVIRFTLTVVQADGVVIVDDAPAGGGRADYQKLLANLLFALGHRPAALGFDIFQWPPAVRMSRLDHSEAAARETFSAYLQKRLQNGGTLLLLGESAGHWVPAELRQQFTPAPLVCGVSLISLWTCLREPAAKRQLWQDLRPLAAPR